MHQLFVVWPVDHSLSLLVYGFAMTGHIYAIMMNPLLAFPELNGHTLLVNIIYSSQVQGTYLDGHVTMHIR